jgi:hypothetical protein
MFELITTYYKASEPEREIENIQCLLNNLNHPLISTIHLFLQDDGFPNIAKNAKLKLVAHGKRPTFNDLFSFSNSLHSKSIKIVANSDIYFDESLILSLEALKRWDILALTRWDLHAGGIIEFYNNFKSQDVWIFTKVINDSIGNYHIGRHGCDNRLVYEFRKMRYKIANPSFSIKTIHLHQSALRTYFEDPNYEFVMPPYGYLLPISLDKYLVESIKVKYFSTRYRYYKSISNQTMSGVVFSFLDRKIAFIYSKYYAQRLKLNG